MIAHGSGVGTGIANTVNELLGQDIVLGFDAKLSDSPREVYDTVKARLSELGVQEALLLVDMGSLTSFATDLSQELGIPVRCLSLVSTLHALTAARKAMLGNSLDVCYGEARRVDLLSVPENRLASAPSSKDNLFILAVCATSHGSAQMIKSLLESHLVFSDLHVTVLATRYVNNATLKNEITSLSRNGRILCIASALPIETQLPFFNITDLLSGNGLSLIQDILDFELAYSHLQQTMTQEISDFSEETFDSIRDILRVVEQRTGIRLWNDVFIGVLSHTCFVLDRSRKHEPVVPFPTTDSIIEENPQIFSIVEEEFTRWAKAHQIFLCRDELCYLAAFFVMQKDAQSTSSTPTLA